MDESSLKRLMRLAQKTGDVLIVTDSDGREPLVLMSVDRYEDMRLGPEAFFEEGDLDEDLDGDLDGEEAPWMPLGEEDQLPSIHISSENEEDSEGEFDGGIGPVTEEPEVAPIPEPKQKESQPKNDGEEQFYLEPIE